MGVPLLYREIIKKYPQASFWKKVNVDYFYIDFNAIIYKVVGTLSIEKVEFNNIPIYEDMLIGRTIQYLKDVIAIIDPKKMVYIAVDGSVVRSKMIKQRFRRYKSVLEYNYKKELEKKYNLEGALIKNNWTTASISPGTVFMEKLSENIIKAIKCNEFGSNLRVIYDDYNSPGEGEHKILNHMRKEEKEKKVEHEGIVIYSPDADLIVLSVMSHINNIYILKDVEEKDVGKRTLLKDVEEKDVGKRTLLKDVEEKEKKSQSQLEFIYLSIDICRNEFVNEIRSDYSTEISREMVNRFLADYSFLTFLCGNDFVTASPFLKIKESGTSILMDIYNENKGSIENFLIEEKNGQPEINLEFFKKIVKSLSLVELSLFQKQQKRRDYIRKQEPLKKTNSESSPLDVMKEEFSSFQHDEYFKKSNPMFSTYNKLFNSINYYSPTWNSEYNSFFKLNESTCHEYYKSLVYCLKYYNNLNNDWEWFYSYRTAPTFSDLFKYLSSDKFSEPVFAINSPLTPFVQLLLILPKKYMFLLPKQVQLGKEFDNFFKENFELDVVYGCKFIYSDPILEECDINVVKKYIKGIKFNKKDEHRNTLKLIKY